MCCLIYRPCFAPEFVWPNPSSRVDIRLSNCPLCAVDRGLPVSGFPLFGGGKCDCVRGVPLHRSNIDVLVFPACIRGRAGSPAARGLVAFTGGLVGFDRHRLPGRIVAQWPYSKHLTLLLVVAGIAVVPLLRRPRLYIVRTFRRWYQPNRAIGESSASRGPRLLGYRACYVLSVLMLVLLIGVLTPMALFRASLSVERRLQIKRAQLHLASALEQHQRRSTINMRKGIAATPRIASSSGTPPNGKRWGSSPCYTPDGSPSIQDHSAAPGTEVLQPLVPPPHLLAAPRLQRCSRGNAGSHFGPLRFRSSPRIGPGETRSRRLLSSGTGLILEPEIHSARKSRRRNTIWSFSRRCRSFLAAIPGSR